jgi:hypothetical protein
MGKEATQFKPGEKPASRLATGDANNSAPNPAAARDAASTVPQYGGNRGGRPRFDGLVPGSEKALEADRLKNTLRKSAWRARLRAESPPALPSMGETSPDSTQATPGSPGVVPLSAPLPWDSSALRPLFEELIPSVEQITVSKLTGKAARADLSPALLKEIEKDARWSQPAKVALATSGPQVAAKWLTKWGVDPSNQAEVVFCTAIGTILVSQQLLHRKLDKLIRDHQAAKNPPPQPTGKTDEQKKQTG